MIFVVAFNSHIVTIKCSSSAYFETSKISVIKWLPFICLFRWDTSFLFNYQWCLGLQFQSYVLRRHPKGMRSCYLADIQIGVGKYSFYFIYSCSNSSKIAGSPSGVMDIASGHLVSGFLLGSLRSWTFNIFSTANQQDEVVGKLIFWLIVESRTRWSSWFGQFLFAFVIIRGTLRMENWISVREWKLFRAHRPI